MASDEEPRVIIVGGGIAGLTAGIFLGRAGLETAILDSGNSILRRNAHVENYPGFPAGVNPRLLLEMTRDQAERANCDLRTAVVTDVSTDADGFVVTTDDAARYQADCVIAATKNTVDFLEHLDGVGVIDRGKTFIDTDERGRTGVDGLYAAGRLALKPYQAIVNAGHGAEVAVTLLEDIDRPFYHDWVAPAGYFTDRGRDLPPGCEEIDDDERRRREAESMAVMTEYFAEPHPSAPVTHPSLRE